MPLRVAICGGGIGGLALALVLKTFASPSSLAIDVYEAGEAFTEVGAGITIWQRTRSIFESLGLAEVLERRKFSPPFTLRKSDTKEPFAFYTMHIPNGSITLPRADMIQLLVESLQREPVPWLTLHFSKRLKTYEQDESGVTLHFADGSDSRAHVLVGADGIGSPTRKTMYADMAARVAQSDPAEAAALLQRAQPTWTGTYAYRTLLDTAKLRAGSPDNCMLTGGLMWCGTGQHVISYPISPTAINILVFETIPGGLDKPLTGPSATPASSQDIVRLYKDWEDDLCIAMEHADNISKWAICHIRDLPRYADGRAVLLGDSAHAMSTHFGAGAGQAIEDAYILGRVLTRPGVTSENVADALQIYDEIRRPIAQKVIESSLTVGFLYELHPEYLPAGTDVEQLRMGERFELKKVTDKLQEIWSFHGNEMPERDWERACVMFDEGP